MNISIDDVSPHPKSSIRVVENCQRILQRVPSAKFTLFVPTAYWRTIPSPPDSMCPRPYNLSEFPEFCRQLSALPPETYEVGFHGHYHGIPRVSNNDELKSVTASEASIIFEKMMKEVMASGLDDVFKMILRPPAWRLSPGGFEAARGIFDILAINSDPQYAQVYGGMQNDPYWKDRIVYQDAVPPIIDFPQTWERLEVVTHACEWDRNYLSERLADSIADLMIERGAVGSFMGEMLGKV